MKRTLIPIISILMVAVSISLARKEPVRLPTSEQLKESQQKRIFKTMLESAIERPLKAAKAKIERDQLDIYRKSVKPRSPLKPQDKLKRLLRKSTRWQRFGHRGPVSDRWIQAGKHTTRTGPTILINGATSATIDAGETFEISLTFTAGEDSAIIDIFHDVNGNQVVDAGDISLFGYLFPGKGGEDGPEAPFWVYDNSGEDENTAEGEFLVTIDEFPYMGMDMIFRATDGGGAGQAYLTVNNLTGDYTASGTVSPVTVPVLVFFSHEWEDEPFMTFTDDAGAFSFDFLNLEGGFMLGAFDAALGISSGQYLFHGWFFEDPGELSGVTLDITRNASMTGSVLDDETNTGIEGAWIGAFSDNWKQIVMGYTTSGTDGSFTIPLQGGHLYHDVEANHPDYMDDFCLNFPIYVAASDVVNVTCELEPWPAFVEGYVRDSETGEPLWDIDVEIMIGGGDFPEPPMGEPPMMGGPGKDDGHMGFWNDTWTDENGYYRMGTILGVGELCARDWDKREYQDYCEFGFEVDQASVSYDFSLVLFDGAITGVVTDAVTGAPIPDVEVHAITGDWEFFQWDRTNHEGRYKLPVLNGTYEVCAEKWWEGYEMECVQNVAVHDNVVTEDLALDPPDGIIQGYVYDDETQEPVSGVGVDAYGEFYYYSETDADGFFKMGVNNGSYEVCFYDWPNTYMDTCLGDITISDDVQEIEMYLTPLSWDGAITGSVVDDFGNPAFAMVGAIDTVNWDWEHGPNFNITMTDMNGEYHLPLNNGEYVAVAYPAGWGYLWDIKSGITVDFDTVTVNFETVVVQIDAVISGSVTDSTGAPFEYAWVSAHTRFDKTLGWWGNEGLFFDDETDENGNFEMAVMGSDDFRYWVYADYWDMETGDLWMGGIDSVEVSSGDTVTLTIVLDRVVYTSEICGYVTLDGQPLAGVEIEAENPMTGEHFSTHTDENGYYCMGIFNGEYDVCADVWQQGMMMCSSVDVWDESETFDFEFGVGVAVEPETLLPDRFALHQNHPNPFNPVTTIRYDLPEGGQVKLTVYDMLGHEVTNLVNDFFEAGYHTTLWDGRDQSGREMATGVYIYRLKAENFVSTKKLILLK